MIIIIIVIIVICLPTEHLVVLRNSLNLEMLVFEERGKPEYLEKNLSKQGREPTTSQIRPYTINIILFDFELVTSFNPQNESTYVCNPILFIFLGSVGRIRSFWILQALKHALWKKKCSITHEGCQVEWPVTLSINSIQVRDIYFE